MKVFLTIGNQSGYNVSKIQYVSRVPYLKFYYGIWQEGLSRSRNPVFRKRYAKWMGDGVIIAGSSPPVPPFRAFGFIAYTAPTIANCAHIAATSAFVTNSLYLHCRCKSSILCNNTS